MNCNVKKCKASCCGAVPIDIAIYNRNKDKMQREVETKLDFPGRKIVIADKNSYCCFLTSDYKCAIYDDRPEVCAKYGTGIEPDLACPELLTEKEKRKLKNRLKRKMESLGRYVTGVEEERK